MPVIKPVGAGTPRADQVKYYASVLAELKGTYQGSYKQYDGMSWEAMYTSIANSYPGTDPLQLADGILGIEAAQNLGADISGPTLGKFLTAANAAIPKGIGQAVAPLGGILTGLNAIGQFFNDLTNPHTWLRIGEGILGILLIATAVSKLASHTPAAQIARKLPLVA